jgi:cytidylate kinase
MPQQETPLIVTLDGPAGSGKSSVARALARRLGLAFLDTGAMYRAIAVRCLDTGIDIAADEPGAIAMAQRVSLRFDWSTDPPSLYADGQELSIRIRQPDAASAASQIAVFGPVRQVLVESQRRIGREHPRLVTEGRDQGSVVFPNAQVKFYLDAAPPVRARRRVKQMQQAGIEADEAKILAQIIERDQRDASRADGPLVCPQNAIRVDTSELTEDQVIDLLKHHVEQRMA